MKMARPKLTDRQKKIYRLHRDRYQLKEIGASLGTSKQAIWESLQRIKAKGFDISPVGIKSVDKSRADIGKTWAK
jgi:biotin operon repressor